MLAKDIMTKEVIKVHKDEVVENVIKLLLEKDISGVPVVDDEGMLVGIVSEGDLIYKSKKFHFPLYFTILDSYIFLEKPKMIEEQVSKMTAYKVESMMSTEVHSAREDDTVEDIATIMNEKGVNRVPVVDESGKVVGIVTRKDIIKSYNM
ncbi:inosine-5'-monophosphate dehydrogenase [Andreesenia angusta]|uniref:Inosine-5'-monophosphate dehydrogenase n=2 Tax=Andreesenia angusta TaxID=39480 RepID=A0A1S1V8X7_9FIRM|nr:inosine-5'-monophosphate dehydrogenase [Andreesenia angusta]